MVGASPQINFLASGDTALVVEFGDVIDRTMSSAVVRLANRIHAAEPAGVVETVPTFRSLLVHYDPLMTSADRLTGEIEALIGGDTEREEATNLWRIPACYEDDLAPDLEAVAESTGLAGDEVVRCHAGERYHVYMIGFLPGYPYMGDLPEVLRLPRRENPRVRVPARSIAIATSLTAIYTYESPGGWHLIGSTPLAMFDIHSESPALFRPGDAVVFEPISRAEYDRLATLAADGKFALSPEAAA